MKQVLITGGATGIGAATAQVFLERGYRVFVTVHQTAAELPGVTAIPCDITDPADVERLFAAVGTVDVLVNNAGISLIRQIQDTTPEDYDALQQMHLINIRYAVLVAFAAGNADQVLVFVHIKGDGIKCFFHIQKSPFPLVLPLIISDCVEKYNRLC